MARKMGLNPIMFPDTSGVLNCPQTGKYQMFPKGGATMEELKMPGRQHRHASPWDDMASAPAAELLDTKCGCP